MNGNAVQVEYRLKNLTKDNWLSTIALPVSKEGDWNAVIQLNNLYFNSEYEYRVLYINPQKGEVIHGPISSFKTFVRDRNPSHFEFAFGSCLMTTPWTTMRIFRHLNETHPSLRFFMLIGDSIYSDFITHIPLQQAYDQLLNDSDFVQYFRKYPSFFQLDDHELENNFDGLKRMQKPDLYSSALQKYRNFIGSRNPQPYRDNSCYYHFNFGDVGFFIIDSRSFRDANTKEDNANKTLLGETQKQRLKEWLLTSQNTPHSFKFVVSPSLWVKSFDIDEIKSHYADGWGLFLSERQEIMDFIDLNNITGVVFLSADTHYALVNRLVNPLTHNKYYEYSVSPLWAIPLLRDQPIKEKVIFSNSLQFHYGHFEINTKVKNPWYKFTLYAGNIWNQKPLFQPIFNITINLK